MYKLKIVIDLHVPTRYGFLEGGAQPCMKFFLSHCVILVFSRVNWLGEQETYNILDII